VTATEWGDQFTATEPPAGWIDLFIERGWVDLCPLLGGRSAWTPTDAGKAVRDAWLPEHLRGSE
jgi:hypothetical protein